MQQTSFKYFSVANAATGDLSVAARASGRMKHQSYLRKLKTERITDSRGHERIITVCTHVNKGKNYKKKDQ
jgi:hypothetical protein